MRARSLARKTGSYGRAEARSETEGRSREIRRVSKFPARGPYFSLSLSLALRRSLSLFSPSLALSFFLLRRTVVVGQRAITSDTDDGVVSDASGGCASRPTTARNRAGARGPELKTRLMETHAGTRHTRGRRRLRVSPVDLLPLHGGCHLPPLRAARHGATRRRYLLPSVTPSSSTPRVVPQTLGRPSRAVLYLFPPRCPARERSE